MLLCLLFLVFSAILMTLSPRGWSPRKQKDAGSLSDNIMSLLTLLAQINTLNCSMQSCNERSNTKLPVGPWKFLRENKQRSATNKMFLQDHFIFFLSWEVLKFHHSTSALSLDQSYGNLSYLHFYCFHNIYSNRSLLKNCEHAICRCLTPP